MTVIQLLWLTQTVFFASLVLLALAMLLHVRKVRKHLSTFDLRNVREQLGRLQEHCDEIANRLERLARESADTTIRTHALSDEIKQVKETSNRYMGVFKTVLYGFDYIVQGCKSSLEIEPGREPEEKQIGAEQPGEEDEKEQEGGPGEIQDS